MISHFDGTRGNGTRRHRPRADLCGRDGCSPGVIFAILTQVPDQCDEPLFGFAHALQRLGCRCRKIGERWWMVLLVGLGMVLYPINVLQCTDKFSR